MWAPSGSIAILRERAKLLARIRAFFESRGVLEVETPIMGYTTSPDRHIDPCKVYGVGPGLQGRYLHTSPEFAMKRLLAAGSGDIYQICKAFRSDPAGPKHNPEFTMLEWYRVGWDHQQLMVEVDDLLQILGFEAAQTITYAALFMAALGVDPLEADVFALRVACGDRVPMHTEQWDKDTWLDYCFSCLIEPDLGHDAPLIVTAFPAAQAALAQVSADGQTCARFEVYVKGMELANGYHELGDPAILEARFQSENLLRAQLGKECIPIDEAFLAAHRAGLPPCAGVALGVDRLMMACFHLPLAGVVSFSSDII